MSWASLWTCGRLTHDGVFLGQEAMISLSIYSKVLWPAQVMRAFSSWWPLVSPLGNERHPVVELWLGLEDVQEAARTFVLSTGELEPDSGDVPRSRSGYLSDRIEH